MAATGSRAACHARFVLAASVMASRSSGSSIRPIARVSLPSRGCGLGTVVLRTVTARSGGSMGPTRKRMPVSATPADRSRVSSVSASSVSSLAQTLVAARTSRTPFSMPMGRVRSAMRAPTAAAQTWGATGAAGAAAS